MEIFCIICCILTLICIVLAVCEVRIDETIPMIVVLFFFSMMSFSVLAGRKSIVETKTIYNIEESQYILVDNEFINLNSKFKKIFDKEELTVQYFPRHKLFYFNMLQIVQEPVETDLETPIEDSNKTS